MPDGTLAHPRRPRFHRAILICAGALDGKIDHRGARAAFLAAAEEADILVPVQ
jgi:hypothetical protein